MGVEPKTFDRSSDTTQHAPRKPPTVSKCRSRRYGMPSAMWLEKMQVWILRALGRVVMITNISVISPAVGFRGVKQSWRVWPHVIHLDIKLS